MRSLLCIGLVATVAVYGENFEMSESSDSLVISPVAVRAKRDVLADLFNAFTPKPIVPNKLDNNNNKLFGALTVTAKPGLTKAKIAAIKKIQARKAKNAKIIAQRKANRKKSIALRKARALRNQRKAAALRKQRAAQKQRRGASLKQLRSVNEAKAKKARAQMLRTLKKRRAALQRKRASRKARGETRG